MAIYLKHSANVKPWRWGGDTDIQYAVKENAGHIYGINPDNIVLAMPMWENAGNRVINYAVMDAGLLSGVDWVGQGLDFNGYSSVDICSLPALDKYKLVSPQGTIIFRAFSRALAIGTYPHLFSVRDATTQITLFSFNYDVTPHTYDLNFHCNGTSHYSSFNRVILNNWATYAATWNGTNINIYSLSSSGYYVDTFTTADIPLTSTIVPAIGNRQTGGRCLNGYVEHAVFTNSALSFDQIIKFENRPWGLYEPVSRPTYFFLAATPAGGNQNLMMMGVG